MRLNPFVYLSETDVLFYLLIVMCMVIPAVWILTIGYVVGTVEFGNSVSSQYLPLILFIFVLISIPGLTYWSYRRSPSRIAKESQMVGLEESKFPEQYNNIRRLYTDCPHAFSEPKLMYNLDTEASAFTFGTRKNQSIQMSAGLLLTDETGTFKTTVQHEMGHLENDDVGKTSLAVSAMSAMKVFLPAALAVFVLEDIYTKTGILYYGTIAGKNPNYLLSHMQLGISLSWIGVIALIFVVFGAIAFVLRNQILRLREFYADARVVEWTKSPADLENILQKHGTLSSRFESLRRFHPGSQERIQVLIDNSRLFVPSLWIAFSAGFLYSFLSGEIPTLWASLFMSQSLSRATPSYVLVSVSSVVFLFGILMFATSSEFHKSILKETLVDKTRYFSRAALLRILEYTVVFSLGFNFGLVILSLGSLGGYFDQLSSWAAETLNTFSTDWLIEVVHLFVVLAFLWFFGSMLIRRSFSRKDARRNFFIMSLLTSALYPLTNQSIAQMVFQDNVVWVLFVVGFVGIVYLIIKVRDGSRRCPFCNNRVPISSTNSLACPHCGYQLYSWAVSSA